MNSNSLENTFAGMRSKFHNYDVLLMPGTNDEPLRFAPGNHVGNQRFRVLLSMFRQRFLQAAMFGHKNECQTIAREVYDIVCKKCVPNGRFFEKGRDNKWHQIGRDSLSGVIMKALKNEPSECPSFERNSKRVGRRSSGSSLQHKAESKELSASNAFVPSPHPFDVVCEANGLTLSQDSRYTGNNRLKVILNMNKKRYGTSNQQGKQRIAKEIVSSIVNDASGHFLRVHNDVYKRVPRQLAIACISGALDKAAEGEKRQLGESELEKLVRRKRNKAILNRIEKRKHAKHRLGSFSKSSPPTVFFSFQRHRRSNALPYLVVSQAA